MYLIFKYSSRFIQNKVENKFKKNPLRHIKREENREKCNQRKEV